MRAVETTGSVSIRISVTDRCQLRCLYCMGGEGIEKVERERILSFEEMVAFVRAVRSAFAISKVHITGGEPLVRDGVAKLVGMIRKAGVEEVALTTNGQLLGRYAWGLKEAGLTRVNVSLDSLDAETYRQLTRGGELSRTLEGIDAAIEAGLEPVKLNMLILRGVNFGEVSDVAEYALGRGCAVRFLELMPIGPAAKRHAEWFVSTGEVVEELSRRFKLEARPVRRGASAREYSVSNGSATGGTVGFISSQSAPFCAGCSRLRLSSRGELISCLALGSGEDIRELLAGEGEQGRLDIIEHVERALATKRNGGAFVTKRGMAEVGG